MERAYSLIAGVPAVDQWSSAISLPVNENLLLLAWTVVGDDSRLAGVKGQITAIQEWITSHPDGTAVSSYLSGITLSPGSSFVALYLEKEKVICAASRASVALRRAGKAIPLIASSETLQCIVGTLHPRDSIVFGTEHFWAEYSEMLLRSADPLSQVRALTTDQHAISSPLLCGGVLVIEEDRPQQELTPSIERPIPLSSASKPARKTGGNFFAFHINSRMLRRFFPFFVILAILILSIFGVSQIVLRKRSARIDQAVAPLLLRSQQARGDTESPRVERERALSELVRDIRLAEETYAKDPAIKAKLSSLEQEIGTLYTKVSLRREISDAAIFYDFRLVTADLVPQGIALDPLGKLAVFLDPVKRRLVTLSLEKKQPQTLSIPETLGTPLSITVEGGVAYVLGTGGVYSLSLPLNTEGKMLPITKEIWQTPALLGGFSKNLYVFDTGARQILRYDSENLSASPSSWLKNKEGVEINQITSLSIDGDVWMGTNTGKIYKFSRGDRASFNLTGILSPPQSSVFVYTSPDTQKLYILEPRQERLIIANKTGEFIGVYVGKDFAGARGIVVDEESQTAYMLAGSIVYQIPITVNSKQ